MSEGSARQCFIIAHLPIDSAICLSTPHPHTRGSSLFSTFEFNHPHTGLERIASAHRRTHTPIRTSEINWPVGPYSKNMLA